MRALINERKREIHTYYAGIKLQLPGYLKNVTIGQLREAGGIVDHEIHIPKKAAESLRAQVDLDHKRQHTREKLEEVRKLAKQQVKTYYKNIKLQLPEQILKTRLANLSDEMKINLILDKNNQYSKSK